MSPTKRLIAAALLLASCSQPAQTAPTLVATDAPAGEYSLDPAHADLTFRVNHIGFSMYTARFSDFDAVLQFDPANPAAMSVSATIDVASLALPAPPEGFTDELLGPRWFDAARFPHIAFHSTSVEISGANTARVTGDLTLHGQTNPVVLEAAFNGGYAGHELEPRARIGFSAHGVFRRSDFGIALGIPPEGSTLGVSDEVEVRIEAEFNGPPWAQAGQASQ